MVICRPEWTPDGSPPQPSTQPPSPMMMLGPEPSAEIAELDAGLWDLLPQPNQVEQATTMSAMAIPSLSLREPANEELASWTVPKLGAVSCVDSFRVFADGVGGCLPAVFETSFAVSSAAGFAGCSPALALAAMAAGGGGAVFLAGACVGGWNFALGFDS